MTTRGSSEALNSTELREPHNTDSFTILPLLPLSPLPTQGPGVSSLVFCSIWEEETKRLVRRGETFFGESDAQVISILFLGSSYSMLTKQTNLLLVTNRIKLKTNIKHLTRIIQHVWYFNVKVCYKKKVAAYDVYYNIWQINPYPQFWFEGFEDVPN